MIFSPDIDIHALKDELKNEIKHEIKEHFLNKVVPSFDTPDDDYFNRWEHTHTHCTACFYLFVHRKLAWN